MEQQATLTVRRPNGRHYQAVATHHPEAPEVAIIKTTDEHGYTMTDCAYWSDVESGRVIDIH